MSGVSVVSLLFIHDAKEKEGKEEEENIVSLPICREKIPLDGGIFFILKTC
jgi:hypothetical protein